MFLPRLESVRGLAALAVAGFHTLGNVPIPESQRAWLDLVRFPMAGHSAVSLFFVLSGLVLGFGIRRWSGHFMRHMAEFCIRRVLRIYPALAVTIGLIAAWQIFGEQPWLRHVPEWARLHIAYYTPGPITWKMVARNLDLQDATLNVVFWTLKVEIVGSLALPLMHAVSSRVPAIGKGVLLAVLTSIACAGLPGNMPSRLFLFYLGYLLPEMGPAIGGWIARRPRVGAVASIAAALVFFAANSDETDPVRAARWLPLQGFPAAWLLAHLVYGPQHGGFRLLDWHPVRVCGRLSYSFYLLHWPVLWAVTALCLFPLSVSVVTAIPWALNFGLLLVSVSIALLLAHPLHALVERPSIAFGKRVTAGIVGR